MTDTPAGIAGLTPLQLRTLQALRRTDPPLTFDQTFVDDLRHELDGALDELGARMGDDQQLSVTKWAIGAVLDCEAHHLAPDDFSWTPARARGSVAHKAIQLLVNWRGEPTPADAVDDALARLADDERSLGDWVAGLSSGDLADLRGQTIERVTTFVECFPPLDARWHPMTESPVRYPIDGPIVLKARVDLVVGRQVGRESRKVIVDLKSGRIVQRHRDDLRFYALVHALRTDVPPRKLASFSLDAGAAVVEDVNEPLLRSALARTIDAMTRMVELHGEGREPTRSPGPSCRWCPLTDDCAPGRTYLMGESDGDPDADD